MSHALALQAARIPITTVPYDLINDMIVFDSLFRIAYFVGDNEMIIYCMTTFWRLDLTHADQEEYLVTGP